MTKENIEHPTPTIEVRREIRCWVFDVSLFTWLPISERIYAPSRTWRR